MFILITGCSPHNINFVVSDNASLQKLNELVQDRTVQVITKDSIYSGNNIIINSDSTVVENISTEPKVIPYSNMKSIHYTTTNLPLNGIIELKNNEQIAAQNIYIANIDTVIKFDEVNTTSVIFPTSEIIKIQRRDHIHSTLKGLGMGLLYGAATGAILGTFVGDSDGPAPPNAPPQWGTQNERLPRVVIFMTSTIACGILGSIVGSVTGAILGQWQDINIQFDKK